MSSDSKERFIIKDAVHGSIELKEKVLRLIIDSKQFQRLRRIKQLGGASYVYPGANHTRFEHSIGVCYIASELMKSLMEDEKAKKVIDDARGDPNQPPLIDYVKCVKVAALCHDLGHGPYSHLYDMAVKGKYKASDKLARHEYRSVEIFKKIREENSDLCARNLDPNLDGISDEEEEIIGKMITFSEDYKEDTTVDPPNTAFLYEIVANGFTGIDVDKMDYFIRDGHGLGLSSNFDWRRYIHTLKVIETESGVFRLCSRDKEALELYQFFHIRNMLYHQAYRHKTTIAVEYMIRQALIAADKDVVVGRQQKSILKAWEDTDTFLLLNDSIEDILMEVQPNSTKRFFIKEGSDGDGIKEAQSLIEKVRERELIKFIGVVKEGKEEEIHDKLLKTSQLHKGDIAFESAKFHYGKENRNPLDEHFFYDKRTESVEHLPQDKVSEMLPKTFMEKQVMFYYHPQESDGLKTVDVMKIIKQFEKITLELEIDELENEQKGLEEMFQELKEKKAEEIQKKLNHLQKKLETTLKQMKPQ